MIARMTGERLKEEATMECWRCNGLTVEEWLADELDEAYVWRCLNCGSLTDEIIQRNRKLAVREESQALI